MTTHDPVNRPAHYTSDPSGVECRTITRHRNFNIGSAMKYLWRAGLKDADCHVQDLEKAINYIRDEIERLGSAPHVYVYTDRDIDRVKASLGDRVEAVVPKHKDSQLCHNCLHVGTPFDQGECAECTKRPGHLSPTHWTPKPLPVAEVRECETCRHQRKDQLEPLSDTCRGCTYYDRWEAKVHLPVAVATGRSCDTCALSDTRYVDECHACRNYSNWEAKPAAAQGCCLNCARASARNSQYSSCGECIQGGGGPDAPDLWAQREAKGYQP